MLMMGSLNPSASKAVVFDTNFIGTVLSYKAEKLLCWKHSKLRLISCPCYGEHKHINHIRRSCASPSINSCSLSGHWLLSTNELVMAEIIRGELNNSPQKFLVTRLQGMILVNLEDILNQLNSIEDKLNKTVVTFFRQNLKMHKGGLWCKSNKIKSSWLMYFTWCGSFGRYFRQSSINKDNLHNWSEHQFLHTVHGHVHRCNARISMETRRDYWRQTFP